MANSGMLISSFYLKKRNSRGESDKYKLNTEYYSEANNIVYKDFFQMINTFCEVNSEYSDDEKSQKMFSINTNSIKYGEDTTWRAVSFDIYSGAYGIESEMTNRITKSVSFHRGTDDADIKRFKCLIFIPKDIGDLRIIKGIIIFQSIATYGVKTICVKRMKEFFANCGLTLEVRSVSVKAFIEKLIKSTSLIKITLIKNNVSPNKADNMLISTGREEISHINPVLRPSWIKQFLTIFEQKEISKNRVYEIDNEEFEDIKLVFKIGGKPRVVALRNIDKLSIVEEIPSDIFLNGRYKDSTLIEYMIETALDYKERMVFN